MTAPNERARNAQRFKWHEDVLADHHDLTPSSILIAGFVMHRYSARDGYATVSMRTASKQLKIERWTAQSACKLLVERGWLYRLNPTVVGTRNPAARFALGDGPGDGLGAKAIGGDGLGAKAIWPQGQGHDGLGAKATSSVRVSDSLPCRESSREVRKIQKEEKGEGVARFDRGHAGEQSQAHCRTGAGDGPR